MAPTHHDLTYYQRRALFVHSAVADKLLAQPDYVLAMARATLIVMSACGTASKDVSERWSAILDRPPSEIAARLADDGEEMCRLRSSTPFSSVLSVEETVQTVRRFSVIDGVPPAQAEWSEQVVFLSTALLTAALTEPPDFARVRKIGARLVSLRPEDDL